MSDNIGWLFYRKLYQDTGQIRATMDTILKSSGTGEPIRTPYTFKMRTTYPGLLIGSGYSHGISDDNDSKLGFYFDHISGLPTIPGSSIKGVLRSMFGYAHGKTPDPYLSQKHDLICTISNQPDLDVTALAQEIFEGITPEGKRLSVYERDRFLEARIDSTGEDGLLSDDYITPHSEDGLSEPTPLRFIKISPEVTFGFAFELHDSDMMSATDKLLLFAYLIQWHGLGAKTNVNYGQFDHWGDEDYSKLKQETIEAQKRQQEKNLPEDQRIIEHVKQASLNENLVKYLKNHEKAIMASEKLRDELAEIIGQKEGKPKPKRRAQNAITLSEKGEKD